MPRPEPIRVWASSSRTRFRTAILPDVLLPDVEGGTRADNLAAVEKLYHAAANQGAVASRYSRQSL